jgi:hypothetical protein
MRYLLSYYSPVGQSEAGTKEASRLVQATAAACGQRSHQTTNKARVRIKRTPYKMITLLQKGLPKLMSAWPGVRCQLSLSNRHPHARGR